MESSSALTILVIVLLTPFIIGHEAPSSSSQVIAPHCSSMCGDVVIPYPFGIEEGCYYNDEVYPSMMKIRCDDDKVKPPQPIHGSNMPVSNISVEESEIRVSLNMSYDCYSKGHSTGYSSQWTNLKTFTISSAKNRFVAIGCDTYAWFTGFRNKKAYNTGCMTKCNDFNSVSDNNCTGVGCCDALIPKGVNNITTTVGSFYNHKYVSSFNPCGAAFPVATDAFTFLRQNLTQGLQFYSQYPLLPVVFHWRVGNQSCSQAQKQGTCLCKNNSNCYDVISGPTGYRCKCNEGFSGNPYLPQGEATSANAQEATMEMAR